ncbi:MAG: mechanosensitive ion channel [Acidobacteriota bacterium]|nr:mechanosensitive ion channel [Acidobacteriota bacterium]
MSDQEWRLIATIAMVLVAVAAQVLFRRVRRRLKELIRREHPFGPMLHSGLDWAFVLLSLTVWVAVASGVLAAIPQTRFLNTKMLGLLSQGLSLLDRFFESEIVPGKTNFKIKNLFMVVAAFAVIALLARGVRRLLLNYILNKAPMDLSVRHAIATSAQYLIVIVGFLVLLQSAAEIDLTMLGLVAGGVGVGVGFGLQNIANNLISGIFILFERPIKVGDRIEVGEVHGHVVHIAARATTVRTNDNIDFIIPNSSFTSFNVINWSHGDQKVRFRIPVPVAYGSDVRQVERLLLEVAEENENVLKEPSPRVVFWAFGDSALEFQLRVWTTRMLHRRGVFVGQLNLAIYEKFQQHGIHIPFPQRDLHLKTAPPEWKSPSPD